MEIVERVVGRAACKCGWRGEKREVAFEKPGNWDDWDELDRRILKDELQDDLNSVIRTDREEHHRLSHLQAAFGSVYCRSCGEIIALGPDGVLPEHRTSAHEICPNNGQSFRASFVQGGSPGGGKRR